jgi:high-affinity K+ transport system ATPase subunit B
VGNPETVSGTTVSRDIPTNGNFTNTSQTPVIMDVNLVVVATSVVPTTIGVQFDPGVSAGLNSLTDVNAVPITSRVIDASGTTNILVPVELSGFAVE